jgi:hypothetical protein
MPELLIDSEDNEKIDKLNEYIKEGKHIFIFFYLQGCGPCNSTKPAWKNIPVGVTSKSDIVVAEVDQTFFEKLNNVGKECGGFPCIRYIKGKKIEDYDGDRSTDAFVSWIKEKSHTSHKSPTPQKGGSKTCKRNFCEKYYIPRMLKIEKELIKFFKETKKNKLSNAELKMIKKFKNKTYKNKKKKNYVDGCERNFCNKGCKGTMFEDGKKLPKKFTQKYRGNKAMLKSFEEQRTFLFKGKNSVLKDDFYNGLSDKEIKTLKKKGAESGCYLMSVI